jgi:two-component sensor histidine kinase
MIPAPMAHPRSNEPQADGRGSRLTELSGAVMIGQVHSLDTQSDMRLLLREYAHRINNEFTSAISMIAIGASRVRNRHVKQALIEVQDRIEAYAEVHKALRVPDHVTLVDVATYLKKLCRAISRSKLDIRGIELLFVERSCLMSCDRCWRLGLIVSELVTNSARHAFGEGGGSIRVELVPFTSVVECRVTDNGKRNTLVGSGRGHLIVDGLTKSLGGTITRAFRSCGSKSVVRIPRNPDAADLDHDQPE